MSHVDDGLLHALLDGEIEAAAPGREEEVRRHLESCGECRARLARAESDRARATALLDATDPAPTAPLELDALRRRGAVGAPGRRGRRGPDLYRSLAWAASVALALGVGWQAGRLSRQSQGLGEADAMPAGQLRSAVPGIEASTSPEVPAGSQEPAAPVSRPRTLDQAEEKARPETAAAGRGSDAAPLAQQRENRAEEDAARERLERPRMDSFQARLRAAAPSEAIRAEIGTEPSELRDSTGAWSPASPEQVRQILARAHAEIPGWITVRVEQVGAGGVRMIRVTQISGPDTVVMLQQSAARFRGFALDTGQSAAGRVETTVDGVSVLLMSNLPADSLRALSRRLRIVDQ